MRRYINKTRLVLLLLIAFEVVSNIAHAQNGNVLSVEFSTVPNGATLSLNGKTAGITPITLSLAPGIYTTHLGLPGFADWDGRQIIDGSTDSISIELQPGLDLIKLS